MGNHLVCTRYMKFGADAKTIVQAIMMPTFIIVHHMKNVVSVVIVMMFSAIYFRPQTGLNFDCVAWRIPFLNGADGRRQSGEIHI